MLYYVLQDIAKCSGYEDCECMCVSKHNWKMYPVVKAMVDDLRDVAKREMKEKNDGDLGSWKRAVTTADGTWQTRGWHSKNATFTIRNYLNGALLYYHHLCQKGRVTSILDL